MANTAKGDKGHEYEKILVPVSGENADEAAIRLACNLSKLAKRSKCRIIVLYVIQVQRSLPVDASIETEAQKAEQTLGLAERFASGCACEVETDLLQAREAGVAIIDEAIDKGVDLIVMGAGYKNRFGVSSLGPTVLTVLRDATCPVMLIRPPLAEIEPK